MRRVLMLCLAGLAILAAVFATSAFGISKPTLKAVSLQPLVVRGDGFKRLERVRILLIEPYTVVRYVRATRAGSFAVRFDGVFVDACTTFAVRAHGLSGSQAALLKHSLRECPEPVDVPL